MLKFAKLDPNAVSPLRKHPEDAGIDVFALQDVMVWPFSFKVVHTGVTFSIPEGTFLLVKPRGRNNHLTGSGVIDAGYQGEVMIKVVNYAIKPLRIHAGDAIAQLVHLPVICDPVEEVDGEKIHAKTSQRGVSGGIHSKKL
jgi:dUTP pyrophosphatase